MKMKWLKGTLYVIGAMFCLAAPFLVLPMEWWKVMAGWFVDEQQVARLWPGGPFFEYALRATTVTYLWIGAVLLVAASDPVRHRVLVDIAICGMFLIAVVTFVTGYKVGLPTIWYLGDSIGSLVGAGLLLGLRPGRA